MIDQKYNWIHCELTNMFFFSFKDYTLYNLIYKVLCEKKTIGVGFKMLSMKLLHGFSYGIVLQNRN